MTSPKRSLSPLEENLPDSKRARVSEAEPDAGVVGDENEALASLLPTPHAMARAGIQRSIALVLKHDGFDTASPEAMESFTQMVETYLKSIIDEIKHFALSSRREHPTPTDFEHTLRHHNIPMSSLKPHLRHPIPNQDVAVEYVSPIVDDEDAYTTLPLLGEELSGKPDKDEKAYIPSSFPDFPSRHTYSFTPQEDSNSRDSKKIREEAARTAQHGEDALRRLVRASKMRKQKEVKVCVEQDPQGKERFRLWEACMKRFIAADNRGEYTDDMEIADHSMIVNSEAQFFRKEVARFGKRSAGLGKKTGLQQAPQPE